MNNISGCIGLARPRNLSIAFSEQCDFAILQVPAVVARVLEPLRPEPTGEHGGLDPSLVSRGVRHLLALLPETITLPDAVSPVGGDEELDAGLGGGFGSLGLQRRCTSADSGDEDIDVLEQVGGGRRSDVEGDDDGPCGSESLVGIVVFGLLRVCEHKGSRYSANNSSRTGRVSTVTAMSGWLAFRASKLSMIGRPICPAPQMANDLYPDMLEEWGR
jgi:hypothetical protein